MGITVKRTGRIQAPNLDNGALTFIGRVMVKEQLRRWSQAINAAGNSAKWLSMKYTFEKQAYTGINRPKRDMKMTGALVRNYSLRKANDGMIRAEPTQRLTRQHASRANSYEQMIGFAGTDQVAVFRAAQDQYGKWLRTAWVPIYRG